MVSSDHTEEQRVARHTHIWMSDSGQDFDLSFKELGQDRLERRRGRALLIAVKASEALGGNLRAVQYHLYIKANCPCGQDPLAMHCHPPLSPEKWPRSLPQMIPLLFFCKYSEVCSE